jgi:hypothetical protein
VCKKWHWAKGLALPTPPAASLGSGDGMVAQKVSGLDFYNGSSEASLGSGLSAPISVQDRLRTAKAKVTGSQMDHKQDVKKASAAKDVTNLKRRKKVLSPDLIAQSFVGLQQEGWKQAAKDKQQQALAGDVHMQEQEIKDPAALRGHSPMSSNSNDEEKNQSVNLTGSHGETRQEK